MTFNLEALPRIALLEGELVARYRILGVGNLTDPEFEREQREYLACPSAFWNRPDGDYLSDEPYVPVTRLYDPVTDLTYEFVKANSHASVTERNP